MVYDIGFDYSYIRDSYHVQVWYTVLDQPFSAMMGFITHQGIS